MRRRTSTPSAPPQELGKMGSLDRGLQILRCFNAAQQIIDVGDIVSHLAIPKSSTLRLLSTLCEARYVVRIGTSDQYRVHSEAILLGQAFLSGSTIARKARPVLQAFVDRFECHAVLCVPRPEGLLALLYLHSKAVRARPLLGPGAVFMPECTAVGHAWLWTEGPEAQSECLARLRKRESEGGGQGTAAELFQSFHDLERTRVCTVSDPRRSTTMSATTIDLHDGSKAIIGSILNVSDRAAASNEYRLSLCDTAERIIDVLMRHRQLPCDD